MKTIEQTFYFNVQKMNTKSLTCCSASHPWWAGQPVPCNTDKDLPISGAPKVHFQNLIPHSVLLTVAGWGNPLKKMAVSHSSVVKREQWPFQQWAHEHMCEPYSLPKEMHSSIHGRVPDCVSFCWSLRTNSSRFICIVTSCEKRKKTPSQKLHWASLSFIPHGHWMPFHDSSARHLCYNAKYYARMFQRQQVILKRCSISETWAPPIVQSISL